MLRPDKRNPPPPYQTTVVGNTTWDSASGSHISLQTGTNGFQSTAGSSAGFHSRAGDAGGRRGASEEAAMDMTDRLQSVQGVKVVKYSQARGKPEERTIWTDMAAREFVLMNNWKFVGKRKAHSLDNLQAVSLGIPASELWPETGQPETPKAVEVTTKRLHDHVPDPAHTIRLRFANAVVDIAGYTIEESLALYAALSRLPPHSDRSPRGEPIGLAGQQANMATFRSNAAPTVPQGNFTSVQNGGPRRQRSTLRDMMQQPAEYEEARGAFLAEPELDNGVDAAAAVLKPHTLAEVSGAVPQMPPCYVERVVETRRLVEVLVPANFVGGEGGEEEEVVDTGGGATTVIYDAVANGKSVLAAAAMHDSRVVGAFPGGTIWLRAGRGAEGRLLRMMELAVCQMAEEIERSQRGASFRVPGRFAEVESAADYLASLLVRNSHHGVPRDTLLVLDDVWEASLVEAFETIGFSLLVTTRVAAIAQMATTNPSGARRLIGPLGPLSMEEAASAVARAAASRRAPRDESTALLERTGLCPLAVGVVGSTLKQAQSPAEWHSTATKVRRTFSGLQRRRQERDPGEAEENEDRITASIAAGLSNMPEENQMLYSALCILPPGLPVTCRLLEQVWETGKRTTILAAEAFEHRRLLDRLGPGNFVLHYEAARFLLKTPGAAGDGAWVGSKLRGQGRELAFNRLAKHLDSFDTLRDHLAKRDLWSLKELWATCEAEARSTSGHRDVSCRIYESRLNLLRQEALIVAGPESNARASRRDARRACEATLDLAQALDMVADFHAYGARNNDAARLYRESIESLRQSLELASHQGSSGVSLESRVKRALERITAKLGALLLKQGKEREALHPCAESLSLTRARQGTEGPDGGAGGGSNRSSPHQDVVDSLYSMADALMRGNSVEEAEGMYEEAAIILRKLYGDEPSVSLEARGAEQLAGMMYGAGMVHKAQNLNRQALDLAMRAFGETHPVVARMMEQKAEMLMGQGDLPAAMEWVDEARHIRELFYGRGHPLVAPSLEKQALMKLQVGRDDEARELLEECLALQIFRYGHGDARVAETRDRLDEIHGKEPPPPPPIPDTLVPEVGSEELRLRELIHLATVRAAEDGGREAAKLWGELARLLRAAGPSRVDDCEDAYRQWVDRLQTKIGNMVAGTDEEMAEALGGYIEVLDEQGKELDNHMWEMISLIRKLHGKESLELADETERFGRYLMAKKSYGEAEQLLKRALYIKETKRGRDHPELAGILRAIGRVLFEQNALKDAGDAFERALSIDKRGNAHGDIIEDMRSLGMVYCRQGVQTYEKAENMYRKVVDMDRTLKGGEEDPSVITEINVLAVLLYAQGKIDQAEPLLKRVLALREEVLGAEHVDVAESLVNLAVLHNKRGKYASALPMLRRARSILQQAYGDLHHETIDCLSWIAQTHQKQGQYAEAEEIYFDVVRLNRELLGNMDPRVADFLCELAELLRAQGKLEEAERDHMEAMHIREEFFGEDSEAVAQSAQYLSLLLLNGGRESEAHVYGRKVIDIRERIAEAGGGAPTRASIPRSPSTTEKGYGGNAMRNHAKMAVEKSISHINGRR